MRLESCWEMSTNVLDKKGAFLILFEIYPLYHFPYSFFSVLADNATPHGTEYQNS